MTSRIFPPSVLARLTKSLDDKVRELKADPDLLKTADAIIGAVGLEPTDQLRGLVILASVVTTIGGPR